VRDDTTEAVLAELWKAGARQELVTRVLRAYGPEILSYFFATLGGDGEAGEAFSMFTLNLWQASSGFRGESSFRTWAYALARHAGTRVLRERGRRRRHVPLSDVPEVDALAARLRTETLDYLKSEVKDRVARLRGELDPDEQTLLILRVDRGFTWPEVAAILDDGGDGGGDGSGDETRRVATFRKRFERIKERLKRRASELV
jgi:RNA polymerase sigma-70 factor, ECF subfamily